MAWAGEGTHPCLEPPPHPSGGPPTWSSCTQAAGGSGEGLALAPCGLSDPRPSWHHCSLREGDLPRLPAALNGLFNWGLWMWPRGGQQSCTSTRCLGAAQERGSSEPFTVPVRCRLPGIGCLPKTWPGPRRKVHLEHDCGLDTEPEYARALDRWLPRAGAWRCMWAWGPLHGHGWHGA